MFFSFSTNTKWQGLVALLLWLLPLSSFAQKVVVSGSVADSEGEPLPGASVVLLKTDSTQVTGVQSKPDGTFTLPKVAAGSYILRVTFVGYRTHYRNLALTKGNRSMPLGVITLKDNAKLMREAEVTAAASQVEMRADTFVYNASAFRVPEGSNLEALVKKLPGAEVTDEGTIKINGKEVKKIMVDGKEFFGNDTKMSMKNLPSKMVEKIKSYDRQSDYTRVTGIDDGEEETVLDLTVKKGMKEGWLVNTDLSVGTEERYAEKLSVSRFLDHFQFSLMGSANNVNDRGFGGWGRGGSGLVTSDMAGATFAWENGKRDREAGLLKIGGNVRFNYNQTDSYSRTNSQTFLSATSSQFANSLSRSLNFNRNFNSNFRFEWQPDSMTNIMFRPNLSLSSNGGHGQSQNVTFNSSPYDIGMSEPLTEYQTLLNNGNTEVQNILVNDNNRTNKSSGSSYNLNGNLQVNRRLGQKGRNLTLDVSAGTNESKSESFSRNLIHRYRNDDGTFTPNGITFTNQYNDNPSKSWNWRTRVSYSEPIFPGANLQLSYAFQRRFSDSDRNMYSIDSLLHNGAFASMFAGMSDADKYTRLYLGYVPGLDTLQLLRNIENSQYATYNEYNHDASLMLRYQFGEFRLNAGVSMQPQTTKMDYAKNQLDTTITRHVFNWSPRVDLRWKISNTSQWRLRYNGRMSQPSMTNLLPVTDTSDPLNISSGNPELDPSWTNSFFTFYNNYIPEKQMGWMVNANFSQTYNSISTMVVYDENTGVRRTRPENINGNWNTGLNLMFNSAIGPQKYLNFMTFSRLNYSNQVGYMQTSSQATSVKSTTKTTSLGENLRFNYRRDLDFGGFDIGVNGGFDYMHARNAIQEQANLDTWSFNYGGSLQFNFNFGLGLSTDISQQSRRGYSDATMNTNELIWNAQLSQSFLREKALTFSLQWYDILHQRSNISRTIDATRRRDTWNNSIDSYLMFHVVYQLNLIGNREARAAMGPGFGGPDGPGERGPRDGGRGGNRGGGPRGGGFGGPR